MNLYERGLKIVSDLFDENTYDNLCNEYGVTLPIISYYGLRRAFFSKWPQLQNISNKSAYGRILYNILLHKFKYNTNFLVKWEQELDKIENIENNNFMMKYITNAFQFTNNTTLRWFQYRISHKILATNEYLFKIEIKDSRLCTFCNIESEIVIHLFLECEHVENV